MIASARNISDVSRLIELGLEAIQLDLDKSLDNIDVAHSYFNKQYQQMLTTDKQNKSNSLFTQKTDSVTRKIIDAIESKRPQIKYPVTFPAHLFILFKRLLTTRLLDRIFLYLSKKELS